MKKNEKNFAVMKKWFIFAVPFREVQGKFIENTER